MLGWWDGLERRLIGDPATAGEDAALRRARRRLMVRTAGLGLFHAIWLIPLGLLWVFPSSWRLIANLGLNKLEAGLIAGCIALLGVFFVIILSGRHREAPAVVQRVHLESMRHAQGYWLVSLSPLLLAPLPATIHLGVPSWLVGIAWIFFGAGMLGVGLAYARELRLYPA
jgi:hypothetical protein